MFQKILDNNMLTGHNLKDWLRNLRIVLEFENLGYVLEVEMLMSLKVNLILQLLPSSFKGFIMNYNLNRIERTFLKLLNEGKRHEDVHMVTTSKTSKQPQCSSQGPKVRLKKRKPRRLCLLNSLNQVKVQWKMFPLRDKRTLEEELSSVP